MQFVFHRAKIEYRSTIQRTRKLFSRLDIRSFASLEYYGSLLIENRRVTNLHLQHHLKRLALRHHQAAHALKSRCAAIPDTQDWSKSPFHRWMKSRATGIH